MKVHTWVTGIKNRPNVNSHKVVTDAMLAASDDKQWWSTPQTGENAGRRKFQYYLPFSSSPHIVVRFNIEPPADMPSRKITYEFNQGDKVEVAVLLPNGKNMVENSQQLSSLEKKRAFAFTQEERINFIRSCMERAGVSPSHIEYYRHANIPIQSSSGNQALKRAMDVLVKGVIVDEEKFARAICEGIGRHRTFGFGLLRITLGENNEI